MKNMTTVISLVRLLCGCASQMVEHSAEESCKSQGKTAFLFDTKQSGIPLVVESASATYLCAGPDDITHLPEIFGADAISASNFTGAGILDVVSGSVAEKAGVKKGDIVMEFAGRPIANARELNAYVERSSAGSQAAVKLRRNGKDVLTTASF